MSLPFSSSFNPMTTSKARYEAFLINNVSTISTLESALKSVTWILPGRFKDAELASEALSTLINVVSMYHDMLLSRVIQSNPSYRPLIPSTLHNRFTKAWSDKDILYKWAARSLKIIGFLELVVEMILRRKASEKVRWRSIIVIETIKISFHLLLLKITQQPLVSPPVPERDFDPAVLPSNTMSSPTLVSSSPHPSPPVTPDHLRNNLVPLPPHPLLNSAQNISAEDYLLPKSLTTSSVKPSLSLIRNLSGPQDWSAELIYIFRPLVYASLLAAHRSSPERTNRALLVVLLMECISRVLRRTPPLHAALERSEYARRDKDMVRYLIRGSIWETYTRPKLESFITQTARSPLLSIFGNFAKDWIPLINEYYYYSAP